MNIKYFLSVILLTWFVSVSHDTQGQAKTIHVITLGHVDHGKTTLTAALNQYLDEKGSSDGETYDTIDDAKEDSAFVVRINSSIVRYQTENFKYVHFDAPGHADYVKALITGSVKPDLAILVVSATDGPMPQAREHISIARQVGIENMVVFISKTDEVQDQELLELIEQEVRDTLKLHGYPGDQIPFIRGSALNALNGDIREQQKIASLLATMDSIMLKSPKATGKYIEPKADPHSKFKAIVYVLTKEEGGRHTAFFDQYQVDFHLNEVMISGKMTLPANVEMVMPGDNISLTIQLSSKTAMEVGTQFYMRDGKTIAAGMVTEILD